MEEDGLAVRLLDRFKSFFGRDVQAILCGVRIGTFRTNGASGRF